MMVVELNIELFSLPIVTYPCGVGMYVWQLRPVFAQESELEIMNIYLLTSLKFCLSANYHLPPSLSASRGRRKKNESDCAFVHFHFSVKINSATNVFLADKKQFNLSNCL